MATWAANPPTAPAPSLSSWGSAKVLEFIRSREWTRASYAERPGRSWRAASAGVFPRARAHTRPQPAPQAQPSASASSWTGPGTRAAAHRKLWGTAED